MLLLDKFALEMASTARENSWVIGNLCNAIYREYGKLVMKPGTVIPVNDLNEAKAWGDKWEEPVDKPVDKQTYEDIKDLITVERCGIIHGDSPDSSRLANRILERLGHELPKQSTMPDITPGTWEVNTKSKDFDIKAGKTSIAFLWSQGEGYVMNEEFERLPTKDEAIANSKVIAAAPKLAKILLELLEGYVYIPQTDILFHEFQKSPGSLMNRGKTILREAGVSL